MVRARGPDFLTVDDPLATIEVGSCDGAGKVGTAARLAKQLAPCIFAREDAPRESSRLPTDGYRYGPR